ncbi:MAG: Rieske 2Fe-2S domain-containing protein [Magnetococcales bacterium]|nr:Rieske 2Fe-2S domain-containing protein [Magnetococcales bacterium]
MNLSNPASRLLENTRICAVTDLPALGGKEFTLPTEDGPVRLVLLQHAGSVLAYINGCKHFTGTPLNPNGVGNFLHPQDPGLIRCGVHGALYHVATGACARGECDGAGLDPVLLEVREGAVFVAPQKGNVRA